MLRVMRYVRENKRPIVAIGCLLVIALRCGAGLSVGASYEDAAAPPATSQQLAQHKHYRSQLLDMAVPIDKRTDAALKLLELAETDGAFLREANLSHAYLRGVDFTGADLELARLDSTDLRRSNFTRATLVHASLAGAQLDGARLDLTDLQHSDLTGARLVDANLERANLKHADLRWASLRGASLVGASLTNAQLQAANLTDANLTHAVLEGARYNSETSWPSDFDCISAGAVLVNESSNQAR